MLFNGPVLGGFDPECPYQPWAALDNLISGQCASSHSYTVYKQQIRAPSIDRANDLHFFELETQICELAENIVVRAMSHWRLHFPSPRAIPQEVSGRNEVEREQEDTARR